MLIQFIVGSREVQEEIMRRRMAVTIAAVLFAVVAAPKSRRSDHS
jgi:hypothetical protein